MAYSGRYRPDTPPSVVEKTEEPPVKPAPRPQPKPNQSAGGPIPGLSGILKKIEAVGLETDDLLLALILFLMYRESGDKDLLIMLGAMLLS